MMFRRRSKKNSDLFVDSSNHSINSLKNKGNRSNSNSSSKFHLSQSLPNLGPSSSSERRRSQPPPVKGILRIKSLQDSLHSVYGGTVGGGSGESPPPPPDPHYLDASFRSSQSDDMIVRNKYKNVHEQQRRPSVLFKAIEIREYERTVGDNPSCSSGPPVSISWEYYPHVKNLPLDDYETYRPNRRSSHEMILSRELRDIMLRRDWDVSRAEIAAAIRDTVKIKNQRRQTVQNLNKDKVEELFEGASKKIFRSLMFKSSTTQELDLLNQQYNAVQELRQQEMKLSRQEQQQPFGNNDGNNTTGSSIGIKDSFVVVGLNIEETEMNEDLDDIDDDDELKEVFVVPSTPETQPASVDQQQILKKPILIVEDDDDAAMLMNVESMKSNGGTTTGTSSRNTMAALIPDREQYKGETSSQDGSINTVGNLNHSRHRVTYDIVPSRERVQVDTTTAEI